MAKEDEPETWISQVNRCTWKKATSFSSLFLNACKDGGDEDAQTRTLRSRSRRTPSKLGNFYEMDDVDNVLGSDAEDQLDEDDSDDDPSYVSVGHLDRVQDDKERKAMEQESREEDWATSQYKPVKRKKSSTTGVVRKQQQKVYQQQTPSSLLR